MRSKKYWQDRATALEYYMQQDATKTRNEIMRLMGNALDNIDREISKIRHELGKVTGKVSEEELDELLGFAERDKSYQELLKIMNDTDDAAAKAKILDRINAQAYGARIKRVDAVGNKILGEFIQMANKEQVLCKELFSSALEEAYYTNIYNLAEGYNAGVAFDVLPKRAIQNALSAEWKGDNFSSRIWKHSQAFAEQVEETVISGLMTGKSVPKMAMELNGFAQTDAYYVKERLIRSEMAHFMSRGQNMAYAAAGIERYRFLAALSERTCEVCGALDNKVYAMEEAVDGETFPPIHPNCRCVTITADVKLTSRSARDPVTGENYKVAGDMSFEQWKENLSDEQKQAFDLHVRQMRNKSADQKQYDRYIKRLGAENLPKTFDKFQEMKYTDISRYETLMRGYRTLGEISRKEWNDSFKQKAIETYWEFNKAGVEMSSHALARYLDRGKDSFSFNDILLQSKMDYNYRDSNQYGIKYYNGIALVYNENNTEIVSIVKRKNPSQRWMNYND